MRRLVLAVIAAAACNSSGDPAPDTDVSLDTDVAVGTVDLRGVWQRTTDGLDPSAAVVGADWLSFSGAADSGQAQLYTASPFSNVLTCGPAVFSVDRAGLLTLTSQQLFGTSTVLLVSLTADVLTLTDQLGNVSTYARAEAVPAEAQCGVATIAQRVDFDVPWSNYGNIGFDGSNIRIPTNVDGTIVSASMQTGLTSNPQRFNHELSLETMQGIDAWTACNCGNNRTLGRYTGSGVLVDEVDTTDLGHAGNVESAAWDGSRFWLVDNVTGADGALLLLKVDTESEPDVVESFTTLQLYPQALAALGGDVYGLVGTKVVRLDLDTGKADGTWTLPPLDNAPQWFGLTSDGTDLYASALIASKVTIVRLGGL